MRKPSEDFLIHWVLLFMHMVIISYWWLEGQLLDEAYRQKTDCYSAD